MKADLPFVAVLLRVTILGGMVRRVCKLQEGKEIEDVKEKDRADPRRRAGGIARGRWPFAANALGKRGWGLTNTTEDSTKKLPCQTIT